MPDAKAPTCFVIMPYGRRKDLEGGEIDFDAIYSDLIQEPLEDLGLRAVRCDEIERPGPIHRDMFQQIALAPFALVDITTLNANVFYELGARHALRRSVTLVIRHRQMAPPPFNIGGLRILEYPSPSGSMRESREAIRRFLRTAMDQPASDSPIFDVLDDLDKDADRRRIEETTRTTYRLSRCPDRRVSILTGDIQRYKGIDVWVNSENTNMQLDRFYGRSLSALIRYLGARKDPNGEILEDTIAEELREAVKGRDFVRPASVYATGAGALADTHGVKRIFHAAVVTGVAPGEGYQSVKNASEAVTRCLALMDASEEPLESIAFPMLGTGAGGADVFEAAGRVMDAVESYFAGKPDSRVAEVDIMAWNGRDLAACRAALDGRAEVDEE
jgi:O-acetyl-ADP-ribose deacetylase (regulator of RNase III)